MPSTTPRRPRVSAVNTAPKKEGGCLKQEGGSAAHSEAQGRTLGNSFKLVSPRGVSAHLQTPGGELSGACRVRDAVCALPSALLCPTCWRARLNQGAEHIRTGHWLWCSSLGWQGWALPAQARKLEPEFREDPPKKTGPSLPHALSRPPACLMRRRRELKHHSQAHLADHEAAGLQEDGASLSITARASRDHHQLSLPLQPLSPLIPLSR